MSQLTRKEAINVLGVFAIGVFFTAILDLIHDFAVLTPLRPWAFRVFVLGYLMRLPSLAFRDRLV